jgi:formate C-acetyltransferase
MVLRPLLIRRALTVARILEEMPIYLAEDELIAGNTAVDGIINQIGLPEFATPQEKEELGPSVQIGLAHKTPDYRDIIARGLGGILQEIGERAQALAKQPPSSEREEALLLYEAMEIEVRAVITLARRYAALAEAQAVNAPTEARRAELLALSDICRRVPEHPPRTFHEALQSTWMVHYALFSTKTQISLSRFDQYCGPLLDADLAAGRLTLDQAREMLACFWIKFSERDQILRENFIKEDTKPGRRLSPGKFSEAGNETSEEADAEPWKAGARTRLLYAVDRGDAVNHWGQNMVLSGLTPEGLDGTNALTYLCLDCLEIIKTAQPVVAVRLHKGSPFELIRRCAEVLKSGGAMPLIFNDDAIVPAYERMGVPFQDAAEYADSNCWETMIGGMSDQEIIRGVSFPLFLEWALRRGVTKVRNIQEGLDTGDPREFASFGEVLEAWKKQMDAYLQTQIEFIGERYFDCTLVHSRHGPYSYNPLLSAMVKDCVARGKDVIRGGARYVIWHVTAEGVANCADALAAIQKLVFDEKSVSMDTLLEALEKNWEGFEAMRQAVISRTPKFANDDSEADAICKELMDSFLANSAKHAARYPGILFSPSVGTFSWYQSAGKELTASADGRFHQDPITSNFSPSFGMDTTGPLAAINSYCQMDMDQLAGGAPTDLRFAASELKGEAGTDRLAAYIRSFIEMGGNMMTLTVTDSAILRAAMADPMKYRSLRVRMGGWSAYWITLSPEQQQVHLSKVEHGLA